jgi:hypothetical protein
MSVATYLHRLGSTVFYPGLPHHPGRVVNERLASGPGAVLGFVTGDREMSERILGATRLWGIMPRAIPCVLSLLLSISSTQMYLHSTFRHASIPWALRAARGLSEMGCKYVLQFRSLHYILFI